jgi:hypothetical protein
VLVALKVAAQYQPNWRVMRDFLSPNAYWHPKSLRRLRMADASCGANDSGQDAATTRKSA